MSLSNELFIKIQNIDLLDLADNDEQYRNIFSTGTKRRLRRNETWRQRALNWATSELRAELEEQFNTKIEPSRALVTSAG